MDYGIIELLKDNNRYSGMSFGFDYMYKDITCSIVEVINGCVRVNNIVDNPILLPFGCLNEDSVKLKDVENLLKDRCLPQSRANLKEVLRSGGIDFYDPLIICKKTEGRMVDDLFWLRFH